MVTGGTGGSYAAETARRIRDDPDGWVPASYDQEMDELGGRLLQALKGWALVGESRHVYHRGGEAAGDRS